MNLIRQAKRKWWKYKKKGRAMISVDQIMDGFELTIDSSDFDICLFLFIQKTETVHSTKCLAVAEPGQNKAPRIPS